MTLIIKSKTLFDNNGNPVVFEFWAPDFGGYVRLVRNGKYGYLAEQICEGGRFTGYTVTCSGNLLNFKYVCRQWYRAYRAFKLNSF